MKNTSKYLAIVFALIIAVGCTDLTDQIEDGITLQTATGTQGNPTDLLASAYTNLFSYQDQARAWCMDEHTSDAVVGPTRGGDWDDNGIWRQLHTHTWGPDHGFVRDTWNDILTGVYQAQLVLDANPSAQQAAEARYLRAYHYFHIMDKYGQVPYREQGSDVLDDAKVYTRSEAFTFIETELNDIMSALPEGDVPTMASKNAARFLLAKMYLNKGVYLSEDPAGPFTFDGGDMDKVIQYVDQITGVSLGAYWDNFGPQNTETSSEIIFASKNIAGGQGGNVRSRWHMGMHYHQTPSGWNGFTTLADYYNKFDSEDPRIKTDIPVVLEKGGYNVGFLVGQMYGPGGPGVGEALKDRKDNPLVFTPDLTLITRGDALEVAGIRGVKYVPDFDNLNNPDNDYVLARYADAILMKAEAYMRKGDYGSANEAIKMVTDARGADAVTVSSENDLKLLDERARELWWEGWRRNDQIRFGTFLEANSLKPYTSDARYMLFSIPSEALANPNLVQNPGY